MKILLTSTSFQDTPGKHQEKLYSSGLEIDTLRGPVKANVLLPIIADYDGIICGDDEISREVISIGLKGKLKVISKYGMGLDKIDLKAAKELGMPVSNTPGVNQVSVSEHVLALLFSYYKNIHLEYNITRQGKWKRLIGHEIFGKKIGILGLGSIGRELAIKAKALGMEVSGYDPVIDFDFARMHDIKIAKNVEELVTDIEILSLHIPLNDNNNGIINGELISKTTQKLVIINTSRALVVDQDSLIGALRYGSIEAYLADVLEEEPMVDNHPLLEFENIIITPHIGSRTYESVQRQGLMSVENLFKVLKIQ